MQKTPPPPKIGYCFDEHMLLHKDNTNTHQERPERTMAIYMNLLLKNLTSKLIRIPPLEASPSDILTVHTSTYHTSIQQLPETHSSKFITKQSLNVKDSYDNYSTYISSSIACGSLINTCKHILSSKIDHAFAIIRPPGHHADSSSCHGFCIFNSVAIATEFLIKNTSNAKVAIIDWDVHHGDGTQKIFYKRQNPLFISIHRHDEGKFYPYVTGYINEVGEDEGKGYNVNIPLDTKSIITKGTSCIGDAEYIYIFEKIVMPILIEYNAEYIIISCGFDAGEGDHSGMLQCTPIAYAYMTKRVMMLGKKVIFALEGGYELDTLIRCSESVVRTLLNENIPFTNTMVNNYNEINTWKNYTLDTIIKQYEHIYKPVSYVINKINDVIKTQSSYWKCFQTQSAYIAVSQPSKHINTITNTMLHSYINEFILNKTNTELTELYSNYIVIKIGKDVIRYNHTDNTTNNDVVVFRKKIKSMRSVRFNLNFNIECIKFMKLNQTENKMFKIMNWNGDEMKYDMNENVLGEIFTLFFQYLNTKVNEFLNELDGFIKQIENKLNEVDIYNANLVIIPCEVKGGGLRKEKGNKFKQMKIKKYGFKFYVNGVKDKNVYKYDKGKGNKGNYINGVKDFRKFIEENIMC